MDQAKVVLFDALQELINAVEDIRDVTENVEDLKIIIEAVEYVSKTVLKRVAKRLEELPMHTLRELRLSMREVSRQVVQGYMLLAKIAYIIYLTSLDKRLLDLGAVFYAISKAWEQQKSGITYIMAAINLFQRNSQYALAVAAYGIKDALPIKHYPREEPWQCPEKWAALLNASYMYEIAIKANAELLVEWGIIEILYEEEE